MEIINYFDLYLGALLNFLFFILIIKKVFKRSINNNILIVFITILITSFFISTINIFNKNVFKILLIFPFSVISIKIIFNTNFIKTIAYVIISNLYMFVGEIISLIIMSIMPIDYTFIFNNILGTTIGTLVVMVLTLPILYIPKLSKFSKYIADNVSEKKQIIYAILIITIIGAFSYKNTINVKNIIDLLSNIAIIIAFILVLYMCYSENVRADEMSKNYNQMLNYLQNYEKELVEKRKIIHDYKNQIIVINSYIGNPSKLKDYLKEIINEQRFINENSIIRNIDKLPLGLKGLIYYKFSHIEENIIVDMQVKNNLSKFEKLPPKVNKKVLKIVGILIDNAIEATITEKEKNINLVFSLQKDIFKLIIINHCKENINCKELGKPGYSTKGKNRGYGLSLVKDILFEEKDISLDLKTQDKEFTAELIVKIRKDKTKS